jgi:hypothetical protein
MNIPEAYADLAAQVFAGVQQSTEEVTQALDVAEAVWRAATDPSCPMRLPAGADAVAWTEAAKQAWSLEQMMPPSIDTQLLRCPHHIDKSAQRRGDLSAAGIVEEERRQHRAPLVEHADQTSGRDVISHEKLVKLGQTDAFECRSHHQMLSSATIGPETSISKLSPSRANSQA